MKRILVSLILFLFLPGCVPSRYQGVLTPGKKQNMQKSYKKRNNRPQASELAHLDEELDSFVLLDEGDEEFKLSDGLVIGSYEDLYLDEDEDITFVDDRDADLYDFKTAYFDFDKYSIRPDQLITFEHNLKAIKKAIQDKKTVVIEGHADNAAGTRAYNLQLSQKRAQTVADWLIEHGIPQRAIKVVGRGAEMLIVPTGNKNEQAPNRRVEIYTISA